MRFFLLIASFLTACGNLHFGGYPNLNDAPPSGTVVASGSFFGLNGKSVSGAAQVYDLGGGQFVLRLDGASFPSEQGLQVVLSSSTGQTTFALRSNAGNQNYAFNIPFSPGITATPSFTQVVIHSTLQLNANYAQASLR